MPSPEARACTPLLKGPSTALLKARKGRAEKKVEKAVRAACVARDVRCRLGVAFWRDAIDRDAYLSPCDGPPEWAHLRGHRRSQTRGMAPELRHTTTHTLMLCRKHHADEEAGRLRITFLSRKGCDGPLKFKRVSV